MWGETPTREDYDSPRRPKPPPELANGTSGEIISSMTRLEEDQIRREEVRAIFPSVPLPLEEGLSQQISCLQVNLERQPYLEGLQPAETVRLEITTGTKAKAGKATYLKTNYELLETEESCPGTLVWLRPDDAFSKHTSSGQLAAISHAVFLKRKNQPMRLFIRMDLSRKVSPIRFRSGQRVGMVILYKPATRTGLMPEVHEELPRVLRRPIFSRTETQEPPETAPVLLSTAREARTEAENRAIPVAVTENLPHILLPTRTNQQPPLRGQSPEPDLVIEALVDTGSGLNIGYTPYWKKVHTDYPGLIKEYGEMHQENSHQFTIQGVNSEAEDLVLTHYMVVRTSLRIDNKDFDLRVALTEQSACNLILGVPFLVKSKMVIRFWERKAISHALGRNFRIYFHPPMLSNIHEQPTFGHTQNERSSPA